MNGSWLAPYRLMGLVSASLLIKIVISISQPGCSSTSKFGSFPEEFREFGLQGTPVASGKFAHTGGYRVLPAPHGHGTSSVPCSMETSVPEGYVPNSAGKKFGVARRRGQHDLPISFTATAGLKSDESLRGDKGLVRLLEPTGSARPLPTPVS